MYAINVKNVEPKTNSTNLDIHVAFVCWLFLFVVVFFGEGGWVEFPDLEINEIIFKDGKT